MRNRLTSTHLVGRVAELAELELALAQAVTGRPGLVLLGGESGVGKTRLLAEFERHAESGEHPPRILRGEAVQAAEGELPYGPLLGALRPLVRERDAALTELSTGSRAQLAALLPGLDDGAVRADRDDPSAQVRLFEALLELFDRLSTRGPLVLIVEDMHWADRSTRAFTAYLARSLRSEPVLVVLSYRSDELHRRHPLRTLLAELERIERMTRIELDPFDEDELSEALADILGRAPQPELVARLHSRAEGNPLFTEELLAASLDGRGAAPQSLRDAFMLRIERLSVTAQCAVRVIAVGRSLSEAEIQAASGLDHDAVQEALREAVAEQVVVFCGDDRLCFRHELLREALYDDLLPGERSELHLALARALERACTDGEARRLEVAASIAAHYGAAGEQTEALRASVAAALAAWEANAPAETAKLAERALELWPRVPDPAAVAGIAHTNLLVLAARALTGTSNPVRAEHLLEAALEEIDAGADPRTYSAVLSVLARTQWNLNRGLQGVSTAKRALALLPEGEPSAERARLLSWLARTEYLRGRFRDSARDAKEALAAAVAAGHHATEAEVLNTLGMAEMSLGDVDTGAERLRHAIALSEENCDRESASYAYSNLADMLAMAGRTRDALETAQAGLVQVPRHLRGSRDWLEMTVSDLAFLAGDWRKARAHRGPAPSELVGVQLIFRLLREAELALGEGDEDTAARCLEQAVPLVASSSEPQWIGALGALKGELHRRRRELEAGRAAIAQALDRIEVCTDDVMGIARVSAAGLRVEADIAQRGRDLAERRDERDALVRARLHMQRLRAAATEGGPVEAAWSATGAAELARARGRSDAGLWRKASERWTAIERPYEVALMRWRAAESEVLAGDRAAAAEEVSAALQTAKRLGSRWLVAELEGLAQRGRLALGRADAAEGPASVADEPEVPEDPFELTAREREVLALIAQGATNRQIGAALFMAEKTASVHVSRILAKLGVSSRTQAAAVAHRLGWASTPTGGLVSARPR